MWRHAPATVGALRQTSRTQPGTWMRNAVVASRRAHRDTMWSSFAMRTVRFALVVGQSAVCPGSALRDRARILFDVHDHRGRAGQASDVAGLMFEREAEREFLEESVVHLAAERTQRGERTGLGMAL